MKIYLAGERTATAQLIRSRTGADKERIWTDKVKRRLFSYFYHAYSGCKNFSSQTGPLGLSIHVEHAISIGQDLFLDSGAFTAFTQKKEIPVKEYADYVKKTRQYWTVCSSLDAIGSGEEAATKSYDYFRQLRDLGADVTPVFHVREPDRWLQRYIDEGYDYILIGGMVPESTRWLLPRLDSLWHNYLTDDEGKPKVKVHGFGLTDQKLMFRFPWTSLDSSSWLMTGVFGACMFRGEVYGKKRIFKVVMSEESPQARKWKGWHYKTLPDEAKVVVDEWLAKCEVTAEEVANHYYFRDIVNASVFQEFENLGAETFKQQQPTLFDLVA